VTFLQFPQGEPTQPILGFSAMKTEPLVAQTHSGDPHAPLIAWIAEHPFFQGLRGKHLRTLADCAMRSHFEPGELIFREGDPANRFYLLLGGKVALESRRESNAPLLIQELGPGDVLGWSWLFPPFEWHFDARALESTDAIFFYGTRLRAFCEDNPEFGYALMKRTAETMIRRLQSTRKQLLASKA
jgi:CRP/FNR family transcriptional regulator, cyclic AMP receptor protein